ncbi:MAG: sugar phosphate nucleotidyltransferase [Patescibacteria group bacterium]
MNPIKKLVLPVAGLGKRLRPLTLTTPKNLIPLAGKPLVEYALDEAAAAGIQEAILVISPEHREAYEEYIKLASRHYPRIKFHLRVQEKPWGHGHAVLQAADVIQNEPFLVRFCDDVILGGRPTLQTLIKLFNIHQAPVVLITPDPDISRYGVVSGEKISSDPSVYKINKIIEKPRKEEAPSNLIVVGGYALTPDIMSRLKRLSSSMSKENDALLINDGINELFNEGKYIYGWEFDGKRLDCGTVAGLEEAEKNIL